MTRLGCVLSLFPALPLAEYVAVAREMEARGYHSAWIGEVSGADAVTVMTLLASHTERLQVGSAVVAVQTRTPVILGLTAATLGHVAPGRILLGLGLSSPTVVEQWHGLRFAPALEQVREAVHIIRRVAAGERVDVAGQHYRVRGFRMTAAPPPGPVRIVLAALGPEMLELAGEIADGVLLNWIPPEWVGASIARLQAGARRAGRRLADFEIAAYIRVCVTDAPDAARQTLARDITGYATVDAYASFFRSAGFTAEVDALLAAWNAGDRAEAVRQVSARLLDGLGVVGDERFCRERIAAFAGAGLTLPIVLPFAPAGPAGPEGRAALLRTLRTFP